MALRRGGETDRDRLFELIRELALKREERVLSSRRLSNFYFDCRVVTLSAEGAYLAAKCLLDKIDLENVDAVGGPGVGAGPLVGAMAILCNMFSQGRISFFLVRKQADLRAGKEPIEGPEIRPGAKVVVVDDVITSGKSAMQAVNAVRARGAEVVKVVVLVDREEGGRELLPGQGISLESVFRAKDFGVGGC
jgi:orotate phosphoribosyltransferase